MEAKKRAKKRTDAYSGGTASGTKASDVQARLGPALGGSAWLLTAQASENRGLSPEPS